MTTLFESLLRKVAGWGKRLAERNGRGQLPEPVEVYLRKEFRLLPADMADLRYVGHSDNFVRVFNAAKAREQGIVIKKYRDLDKHRELALYYGRIDDRGKGHLKREQH